MGHKVNPIGLRLGINRTWDSRWYANKDYSGLLHEYLKLRKYLLAFCSKPISSKLINSNGDSRLLSLATASLSATFESVKRCIASRPRDIET